MHHSTPLKRTCATRYYIYNLETQDFVGTTGDVIHCDKHGYHINPANYYSAVKRIEQAALFNVQDAVMLCSIMGSLRTTALIPEEVDGEDLGKNFFAPKPIGGHQEAIPGLFDFIASKLIADFSSGEEHPVFLYQLYEKRGATGRVRYMQWRGWEFSRNPGVFASTAPGAVMSDEAMMLESLTVLRAYQVVEPKEPQAR